MAIGEEAEIMDELAATIRDVLDNVTDVRVQVEPRWVSNPTYPCVDVYPADPSNDPTVQAMGEVLGGARFNIRARIDLLDNDATQDVLLAMRRRSGDLSVIEALYNDTTLNGLATDVDVQNLTGYVSFSADGSVIGCLWTVLVIPAES